MAPSDGGLGIPSLLEEAQHQFTNSVKISQHHTNLILEQSMILDDLTAHTEQKNICKQENKKRRNKKILQVDATQPEELTSFIKQSKDKGASVWLNALPLEQQRFNLNKEELSYY